MNGLDYIIIGLLLVGAFFGFRRGLLSRIFTWGGILVGYIVSPFIAPYFAEWISNAPFGQFIAGTASIILCVFLFAIIGTILGKIFGFVLPPPLKLFNKVGGAVIGILVLLVPAWYILPLMKSAGGTPQEWEEGSTIANILEKIPDAPISKLKDTISTSKSKADTARNTFSNFGNLGNLGDLGDLGDLSNLENNSGGTNLTIPDGVGGLGDLGGLSIPDNLSNPDDPSKSE